MALEDFTTWTEDDPSGRLTVAANQIDYAGMSRDEDTRVYADKGAAHFAGDFTHLIECEWTSQTSSNSIGVVWGLSMSLDDFNANFPSLYVYFSGTTGTPVLRLWQGVTDSLEVADNSVNLSAATRYYLEIERDEAVGTNGTAYCRIYSDSGRTTLVDTLTITLATAKYDYRYIYAASSYDDNQNTMQTGLVANLDLQEGGGGGSFQAAWARGSNVVLMPGRA